MLFTLPILRKDAYKAGHPFQYKRNTTLVYSNLTARGTRREEQDNLGGVVSCMMQYFVENYLIDQFNRFFELPRDWVITSYKRRMDNAIGKDMITVDHIADLHELGYLPLCFKAVPEGTLVPYRIPIATWYNTKPEFYWLTNMIETALSNKTWAGITNLTTAVLYRKIYEVYAHITGSPREFVKWQGHDFSYRGLEGDDAAHITGMAHLFAFYGTDTLPAIDAMEYYYGANSDEEIVGGSVFATEHSVMEQGGPEGEFETYDRLISENPNGIVSIVSDTYNYWRVISEYLPRLKEKILARNGKITIRPDSGDPVKITCGDDSAEDPFVRKGTVECLWDIFGGSINERGYRVLDPHIGMIYGEAIYPARLREMLYKLEQNRFASQNLVTGLGSYGYRCNSRDTDSIAIKSTYTGTTTEGEFAIFKKPATDDGTKHSAKGLLRVDNIDGQLVLKEECTWEEERGGVLVEYFRDGEVKNQQTMAEIRERVDRIARKGLE